MPRLPHRAEKIVKALVDSGWILINFESGMFMYEHPLCRKELMTPDGVRHWYDFPTYQPLRQLSFSGDGRIIVARTGTPWQGAHQQSLSMPKALAFVAEEFSP